MMSRLTVTVGTGWGAAASATTGTSSIRSVNAMDGPGAIRRFPRNG